MRLSLAELSPSLSISLMKIDNCNEGFFITPSVWQKYLIVIKIHHCDENSFLWWKFIILKKFITMMKIHHNKFNILMSWGLLTELFALLNLALLYWTILKERLSNYTKFLQFPHSSFIMSFTKHSPNALKLCIPTHPFYVKFWLLKLKMMV